MWEGVEAETRKIGVAKTKGRRNKRRERGGKRRKGTKEEVETEKEKNNADK